MLGSEQCLLLLRHESYITNIDALPFTSVKRFQECQMISKIIAILKNLRGGTGSLLVIDGTALLVLILG